MFHTYQRRITKWPTPDHIDWPSWLISSCPAFTIMKPEDREDAVRRLGVCSRCEAYIHNQVDCKITWLGRQLAAPHGGSATARPIEGPLGDSPRVTTVLVPSPPTHTPVLPVLTGTRAAEENVEGLLPPRDEGSPALLTRQADNFYKLEQVLEDQAVMNPPLMEDQAVRTETMSDLWADDDAIATMVPAIKNTDVLGPVPHLPINKVLEDQAAVEAHPLKGLIELRGTSNVVEGQAVCNRTLIDLGVDDDATAAMVPDTRNTHDLGTIPHPPFNEVLKDQGAVPLSGGPPAKGPNQSWGGGWRDRLWFPKVLQEDN